MREEREGGREEEGEARKGRERERERANTYTTIKVIHTCTLQDYKDSNWIKVDFQ